MILTREQALELERNEAIKESNALRGQLATAMQSQEALAKNVNDGLRKLRDLNAQFDAYKAKADKDLTAAYDLQNDYADNSCEVVRIGKELTSMTAELAEIQLRRRETVAMCEQLRAELVTYKAKAAARRENCIAHYEAQVEALRTQLALVTHELYEAQSYLTASNSMLETHQSESQHRLKRLVACEAKLSASEAMVKELAEGLA